MVHTEEEKKFEKKISQTILASVQKVVTGEAGKTGTWRSYRPVLTAEDCICVKKGESTCHLCWLYCPENTITKDNPPEIDLEYCKGCGICAEECPTKAIKMVPESEEEENE